MTGEVQSGWGQTAGALNALLPGLDSGLHTTVRLRSFLSQRLTRPNLCLGDMA